MERICQGEGLGVVMLNKETWALKQKLYDMLPPSNNSNEENGISNICFGSSPATLHGGFRIV